MNKDSKILIVGHNDIIDQSLAKYFKDNGYKNECINFLKRHNITNEHIYLIPELKDIGNKFVHVWMIINPRLPRPGCRSHPRQTHT